MLEKYWKYLYYVLGFCYDLKRKSKKKGLFILKFEGVKVVLVNDFQNRRTLIWYFKEETKQIFRVSYHFYYVRKLRLKIVTAVKGIQNDPDYFNNVIMSRRSYSYKRERAFKSYMGYKARMNK